MDRVLELDSKNLTIHVESGVVTQTRPFRKWMQPRKRSRQIIAAKIIPCTPEFLDKITIRCVEEYAQVGLPLNAEAWKQKIYYYAIKLSGTITGEHGVGLAKKAFLPKAIGDTSLSLMRPFKRTLDPDNI
jgi:hypothetical protein